MVVDDHAPLTLVVQEAAHNSDAYLPSFDADDRLLCEFYLIGVVLVNDCPGDEFQRILECPGAF